MYRVIIFLVFFVSSLLAEALYIRVGAVKYEENVFLMVDRINDLGYSAQVTQAGEYHRIYAGPFESSDQAAKALKKLKKQTPDAYTVRYDTAKKRFVAVKSSKPATPSPTKTSKPPAPTARQTVKPVQPQAKSNVVVLTPGQGTYTIAHTVKKKTKPKPVKKAAPKPAAQMVAVPAVDIKKERARADELFNEGKFGEAYDIYKGIYLHAPGDKLLHFNMGRSAYETGRYTMALAAFERVEMIDPFNLRNQLEMGRTYYRIGMLEDSRLRFDRVLAQPALPDNVRTNIELFMSRIDDRLKRSFFFARIRSNILYDTNVNYGSIQGTYTLPDFGQFASSEPLSDFAYENTVDLTHLYDFGMKNGFALRNKFTFYSLEYDTMEEYDITYLSYNPALIYKGLNTNYELNFMLDRMQIHHVDYMNSYGVMPSLYHAFNPTSKLLAHAKYAYKEHIAPFSSDLDADYYELSLGYQHLMNDAYLTLKATGEAQRRHQGDRVDIDYDRYRLNVDYTAQLAPSYVGIVGLEGFTRDYLEYNSLFHSTREDNGYRALLEFNKQLYKNLFLESSLQYERVWSNQSIYSYDKSVVKTGINLGF
jgi:hypothetical protein